MGFLFSMISLDKNGSERLVWFYGLGTKHWRVEFLSRIVGQGKIFNRQLLTRSTTNYVEMKLSRSHVGRYYTPQFLECQHNKCISRPTLFLWSKFETFWRATDLIRWHWTHCRTPPVVRCSVEYMPTAVSETLIRVPPFSPRMHCM